MRNLIDIILENTFQQYPASLHYDDWSGFAKQLAAAVSSASEQEFCQKMGYDVADFDQVIVSAVENWRDSTTTSVLHGVGHLDGIPQPGEQIFPDLIWQTRFLMKGRSLAPLQTFRIPNPAFRSSTARDHWGDPVEKPFLKAKNEDALSARNVTAVNDLLRMIYAYRAFNASKKVKVAKTIYRGIRAGDLLRHVDLNDITAAIYRKDATHEMKRKEALDILLAYIVEHGLNGISDGRLLSFSASEPTAHRFANGSGFVIKLNTADVEVVSSEVHDSDRLKGATWETRGKDEREYIVRIPHGFKWSLDNFIISDLEYFLAEENPLCVAHLDHDDKIAHYEINDTKIKAWFQWNASGQGGKLRFSGGDDYWGYGRGEFKKYFGFDPLPSPKNIGSVKNFSIEKPKRRW